jgi:uncharacterized protein
MGILLRFADGLTNALTGMGRTSDPRSGNRYSYIPKTQQELYAAYRGSGLMRKIVNVPAQDMVREGWEWKAEADQVTLIEAEQARHDIVAKVRKAEILRGLGGAAMILGLPGDPASPAPASVASGRLAFVHVVSRWQCTLGDEVTDFTDPSFGQPEFYQLSATNGQQRIHPSRVIAFKANPLPNMGIGTSWEDDFWGESTVEQVLDAVQNSDAAQTAFAGLIQKARLMRLGIPGLAEYCATQEGERMLAARVANIQLAESLYNASIYDKGNGQEGSGEQIDDITYNFAGLKDVMNAFGEFVAAISDIPATRLLGRAPEGMNSAGESQQKDWNKMVRSKQTIDLKPCLDGLMRYLVPSALGSTPAEVWYDFAPLDMPTEAERAKQFETEMKAIETLDRVSVIPRAALAEGVQSLMVEQGYLPALESALAKIDEAERFGEVPEDDGMDPSELAATSRREVDPDLAGEGDAPGTGVARRAANDAIALADATPRTLYVQRKLLNAAEFIKWAKSQGFDTVTAPDDLHVTVAYSKTAIDWMKIESEDWNQEKDGTLEIAPGGVRIVEALGDKGAVVLLFTSSRLSWRHEQIMRAGASHDFPDYQPHVTISYSAPADLDLSTVEPYRGALRFGPELFEVQSDGWRPQEA